MTTTYEPTLITNASSPQESPQPLRFRAGPGVLKASGSGALTARDFSLLRNLVPREDRIVVFDLRQESHALLNGLPVSWWVPNNAANAGKSDAAIAQDEAMRIAALSRMRGRAVTVRRVQKHLGASPTLLPESVVVDSICDEARAASDYGIGYVRLPMQDRTGAPMSATVDALLQLLWTRPTNTWWHFHCQAGKGRTSIFTALVDMLERASGESLEAVAQAHHACGSVDLLQGSETEPHRSKYLQRIAFMRAFHRYAASTAPARRVLWSTWCTA